MRKRRRNSRIEKEKKEEEEVERRRGKIVRKSGEVGGEVRPADSSVCVLSISVV